MEKQGEFSSEDKSYIVTIPLENSGDGFLYQYNKDNQLEQKHGEYEKISNSLARLTSTDGTIFYLFETVEDSKQGVKLVDETNKNEVFLMKTGNSYVVIEEE